MTKNDVDNVLIEIGKVISHGISKQAAVVTLSEAGKRCGRSPTIMSVMAREKNPKFHVLKCVDSGRVIGVYLDSVWDEFCKTSKQKEGM